MSAGQLPAGIRAYTWWYNISMDYTPPYKIVSVRMVENKPHDFLSRVNSFCAENEPKPVYCEWDEDMKKLFNTTTTTSGIRASGASLAMGTTSTTTTI